MNKVIGIISYLPKDKVIRENRRNKLRYLVYKCSIHLNLPIIIIAQNWKEEDFQEIKLSKGEIFTFDKLGIVGARKKLREIFIDSKYDYLIMLDDDCMIDATTNGSKLYLKEIDEHPSGYGIFNGSLLKLFAISKDIIKEVDYPNISVEDGEGFEDKIFVSTLESKFPNSEFEFSKEEIWEESISTLDPYSTWCTNQNLDDMVNKTYKIIKNTNAKLNEY